MKEDVLKEIEKVGFEKITTLLLAYTRAALKRKYWRTGKLAGPKGEEESDFVQEAIIKALDEWNWNKKIKPDIVDYLKSRIDSLISNSITSGDNLHASSTDIHTETLEIFSRDSSPEELIDRKILEDKLDSCINELMKGGEDRIMEVYDAMKVGYQSQDMIELLDLSESEINNYKKRIRYALKDFRN